MSITNLQNKHITIGQPIEIEDAVNQIRERLAELVWVSHPYFIAQRFISDENGRKFIYPETYYKSGVNKKYSYKRLTADNDFKGMFFAYVGKGKQKTDDLRQNYLSYDVSFIFNVNLEKIDKERLKEERFTRVLISEARKVLNSNKFNFDFNYKVVSETDDLQEVYKEFRISDVERYHRLPLQCFRFDLEVLIQEDC